MRKAVMDIFAFFGILCVLAGCASLQPAPAESISKLPVVRVGETAPDNSEFVLFYPAGYAVPVKLKVDGSLFVKGKEIESNMTLSRDLYLYKQWASYDAVNWKDLHTLFTVGFDGGFSASGIQVNVTLEQK